MALSTWGDCILHVSSPHASHKLVSLCVPIWERHNCGTYLEIYSFSFRINSMVEVALWIRSSCLMIHSNTFYQRVQVKKRAAFSHPAYNKPAHLQRSWLGGFLAVCVLEHCSRNSLWCWLQIWFWSWCFSWLAIAIYSSSSIGFCFK